MDSRSDSSELAAFDFDLAASSMNEQSHFAGSVQLRTRVSEAVGIPYLHFRIQPTDPAPRAGMSASPLLVYEKNLSGVFSAPLAFGPAFKASGALPDVQLYTSDNDPFYAHRGVLLYVSTNAFGGLLEGRNESVHIPETSAILAIALHVVYGLSCLQLTDTTLETVESAIDMLPKYGILVEDYAAPTWPLSQLILSHAPERPIDAYALAAHYGLNDLAVAISPHLLACDLSTLTDELCMKMGPLHCKRLFNLHRLRREALKKIVLTPPTMHPPTLVCGIGDQGPLLRAWAFAAADLVWNALPSTSTFILQWTFETAGKDIKCSECRKMLHARIVEATTEWSSVQRTI